MTLSSGFAAPGARVIIRALVPLQRAAVAGSQPKLVVAALYVGGTLRHVRTDGAERIELWVEPVSLAPFEGTLLRPVWCKKHHTYEVGPLAREHVQLVP